MPEMVRKAEARNTRRQAAMKSGPPGGPPPSGAGASDAVPVTQGIMINDDALTAIRHLIEQGNAN